MRRPRRLFRDRPHRPEAYIPGVIDLAARKRLADRPGVHTVEVWHDADCPRPGGGVCSCKPAVKLADG